jgi:hypothetical protein
VALQTLTYADYFSTRIGQQMTELLQASLRTASSIELVSHALCSCRLSTNCSQHAHRCSAAFLPAPPSGTREVSGTCNSPAKRLLALGKHTLGPSTKQTNRRLSAKGTECFSGARKCPPLHSYRIYFTTLTMNTTGSHGIHLHWFGHLFTHRQTNLHIFTACVSVVGSDSETMTSAALLLFTANASMRSRMHV